MTSPGEVTTMPDDAPPAREPAPDPDLLEYVVVSVPALAPLATTLVDDGVRLTPHDVDLAAATLAPGAVMLLLLVEDRWAALLASAATAAGGRLTAGERIGRDRVLGQIDLTSAAGNGKRPDLLARGPLTAASAASARDVQFSLR